jgi:Glycogen recognition site of AMP-activated protein kinase
MTDFHPLVKQLLDGEVTLADLPAELRAEGEEALRLLAAVDRSPVALNALTRRVMQEVQSRPARSSWDRLTQPREFRIRFRPWYIAPALAAAAALVLLLGRSTAVPGPSPVTVRFVLVAPDARQVTVAGTFNQWDAAATPLVRSGTAGAWTATLTLPAGEHQYAFVVDGARWIPDPNAPAVDDGFGRRNSVLAL